MGIIKVSESIDCAAAAVVRLTVDPFAYYPFLLATARHSYFHHAPIR
mgnify:CR=1 FL=1